MIIWTIKIKTTKQHNTYCVDNKEKIIPYVKKCMNKVRKKIDKDYEIKWIVGDYAVIYELNTDSNFNVIGKIWRYEVH